MSYFYLGTGSSAAAFSALGPREAGTQEMEGVSVGLFDECLLSSNQGPAWDEKNAGPQVAPRQGNPPDGTQQWQLLGQEP